MFQRVSTRISRSIRSFKSGQSGFTLIELLVVVMILGVLAVVVVPNVARFASQGQTEAANTERHNVQLAIDAMMADQRLAAVAGRATGDPAIQDFGTPAGLNLHPNWLRQPNTANFYCWNNGGEVTAQQPVAFNCP